MRDFFGYFGDKRIYFGKVGVGIVIIDVSVISIINKQDVSILIQIISFIIVIKNRNLRLALT